VDHLHYFPFGEVWLEERPSSLPADYFFTAKEFDPETGFYNFGARYLDPRFSKWMTADSALGDYLSNKGAGSSHAPLNISLYSYGWYNPATVRDPDGACVNDPLSLCTGYWGAPPTAGTTYSMYQDPEGIQDMLNFTGGTYRADPQVWEMERQIDVGTQLQLSIWNGRQMRKFYDQANAAPGTPVDFVVDRVAMNMNTLEAIKTSAWPFGRVSAIVTGTITAGKDGTYTVSGTLQIKNKWYSWRQDETSWFGNYGLARLGENRNGPNRGDMTLYNWQSKFELGWDKRIKGKLGANEGVPWSHEANGQVEVTFQRPYRFQAHGTRQPPVDPCGGPCP
jgi:RHS repeat-associated protein